MGAGGGIAAAIVGHSRETCSDVARPPSACRCSVLGHKRPLEDARFALIRAFL